MTVERAKLIDRVRRRLDRHGLARLQMLLIVAVTGLVGFGASAALRANGLESMALRYLASVALAYAAFLLLMRLWVAYQRRSLLDDSAWEVVDAPTGISIPSEGGASAPECPAVGGGGQFGGGGAGGSWAEPGDALPASAGGGWAEGAAESVVSSVDLDEGAVVTVPLAVIVGALVLLVGGLIAVLTLIYAAPLLLAELIVDVALVSGLYHRLAKIDSRWWLTTALRHTWKPALAVALLVTVGGWAMQALVPGADTIGEVVQSLAG